MKVDNDVFQQCSKKYIWHWQTFNKNYLFLYVKGSGSFKWVAKDNRDLPSLAETINENKAKPQSHPCIFVNYSAKQSAYKCLNLSIVYFSAIMSFLMKRSFLRLPPRFPLHESLPSCLIIAMPASCQICIQQNLICIHCKHLYTAKPQSVYAVNIKSMISVS